MLALALLNENTGRFYTGLVGRHQWLGPAAVAFGFANNAAGLDRAEYRAECLARDYRESFTIVPLFPFAGTCASAFCDWAGLAVATLKVDPRAFAELAIV